MSLGGTVVRAGLAQSILLTPQRNNRFLNLLQQYHKWKFSKSHVFRRIPVATECENVFLVHVPLSPKAELNGFRQNLCANQGAHRRYAEHRLPSSHEGVDERDASTSARFIQISGYRKQLEPDSRKHWQADAAKNMNVFKRWICVSLVSFALSFLIQLFGYF